VHASAWDIIGWCMHVLHALPHDVTGRCMQLLHGLCCFDFVSDIPLFQLLWINISSLPCCSFGCTGGLLTIYPGNMSVVSPKVQKKQNIIEQSKKNILLLWTQHFFKDLWVGIHNHLMIILQSSHDHLMMILQSSHHHLMIIIQSSHDHLAIISRSFRDHLTIISFCQQSQNS
jgi:hypothetical protein